MTLRERTTDFINRLALGFVRVVSISPLSLPNQDRCSLCIITAERPYILPDSFTSAKKTNTPFRARHVTVLCQCCYCCCWKINVLCPCQKQTCMSSGMCEILSPVCFCTNLAKDGAVTLDAGSRRPCHGTVRRSGVENIISSIFSLPSSYGKTFPRLGMLMQFWTILLCVFVSKITAANSSSAPSRRSTNKRESSVMRNVQSFISSLVIICQTVTTNVSDGRQYN